MRFDCKDLGFHFEMGNDNYIALNDEDKIKFFHMGEQQLRQTPFIFVEVNDNKLTGRYFQITLDRGRYPTLDEIKKGQDLCRDNVKRFFPNFELIDEANIMPQNIRKCVWKKPDGSILSQYYMSKNGFMFCVSGDILQQYDPLDCLMASVCISVTADTQQDLEREKQQKLMIAVTDEANRLADNGIPIDKAMDMALEKFGIKRN